jgi:hypothetical protein
MPLPLAPFVAALLGVVFALVGRDEVRRTSGAPTATRGFLLVVLVSLLLLLPSLAYFLAFYPDWTYAYLVPGERVPSALELVGLAIVAIVAPATYAWTAAALRRHAVRELVRGVSALIILLSAAIAWVGPRLVVATTYGGFHDGIDVRPTSGTTLGASILWIDGWLVVGAVWAATRLRATLRT